MLASLLLLGLIPAAFGYRWTMFQGRVDSGYLVNGFDSHSKRHCSKKGCTRNNDCFVAYNRVSRKCYKVLLPIQLMMWQRDRILIRDSSWSLMYKKSRKRKILRKQPMVLWLLDNISKGRNFGIVGSALNIPTNNVDWKSDAKGPRGSSPLLYARGKGKQAVSIHIGGNYIVDMIGIVTIAMWIKTDGKDQDMCLLCSDPTYAARLVLWPSKQKNQLTLALGSSEDYTKTTVNNEHVNEWRHVAVTYKSASAIFYLNGNVWPISHEGKQKDNMIRPSELVLWTTTSGNMKYSGNMACVAVFQSFLSKDEINVLKDNCP